MWQIQSIEIFLLRARTVPLNCTFLLKIYPKEMEPGMVCRPAVADSHHFDEE
jgi:hypothetical protein